MIVLTNQVFKRKMKYILYYISVTVVLLLGLDFCATHFYAEKQVASLLEAERSYRTGHPVYHHGLLPDKNTTGLWGGRVNPVCTDSFGFKTLCGKLVDPDNKHFDIAFIGDSFTEGIGVAYENSFVGLFEAAHPELRVANLGVSSYAPSIYYKKMQYLLENGFTFSEVVVLPDISDIQDEAISYTLDENDKVMDIVAVPAVSGNAGNAAGKSAAADGKTEKSAFTKFRHKFFFTRMASRKIKMLLNPSVKLKPYPRSDWAFATGLDEHYGEAGVEGGIERAVGAMRKLKRLLDQHDIPMSLAVYPWPNIVKSGMLRHRGVTIWEDFCREENCARFIDANPFFFQAAERDGMEAVYKKYFIYRDVHFNEEGNRVIFEALDPALSSPAGGMSVRTPPSDAG